MKNTFIAYRGNMYTVEWYADKEHHMPAYEFFKNAPNDKQCFMLALFRVIANHGKIYDESLFFPEQEGFYAFKLDIDHYLYCFFKVKKIILTNVFSKKIIELPKKDKKQILDSFKDYKKRISGGVYYSKKIPTTYDEFTRNPRLRAEVETRYRTLLIAELALAAKHKNHKLVEEIAHYVGLTPNIAKEIKNGKKVKPTKAAKSTKQKKSTKRKK